MSETTVLTDKQIEQIELHIDLLHEARDFRQLFPRAIEQAVLQSAEVQALRRDAARWQKIAGHVYEIKRTYEKSPENRVRRLQLDIRKYSPSPSKWLESAVDDLVVDAAMEKRP